MGVPKRENTQNGGKDIIKQIKNYLAALGSNKADKETGGTATLERRKERKVMPHVPLFLWRDFATQ